MIKEIFINLRLKSLEFDFLRPLDQIEQYRQILRRISDDNIGEMLEIPLFLVSITFPFTTRER